MTLKELYDNVDKHLIEDEKPSVYLNEIYNNPFFHEYPFDMLCALKQTNQSPVHHPEGNVWNHMLLVVDEAAKVRKDSKNQKAFMWAALLHDIGKPNTTKIRKGKITAYDHDKAGEALTIDFLKVFTDDSQFITKVAGLVRYHMQILFVVNNLPFADIKSMMANTDIEEIALLGFCDRMGRTHRKEKEEKNNIDIFLRKCRAYNR